MQQVPVSSMLHNAAFMSDVTLRFRKGTHPPGLFISIYILARRGASVKMQRFHVSFVGQTFRNRRPLAEEAHHIQGIRVFNRLLYLMGTLAHCQTSDKVFIKHCCSVLLGQPFWYRRLQPWRRASVTLSQNMHIVEQVACCVMLCVLVDDHGRL